MENLIDESFLEEIKPVIEPSVKLPTRSDRISEEIVSILRGNKPLTASQLSKILHLSRNRCSEYLVKLERSGRVVGFRLGRKKFYKAIK